MATEEEKLPIGWTEQVAVKDGKQLKFYYNVITGNKFYCKTDLLHYIELGSPSMGTHPPTAVQNKSNPENSSIVVPTETNNTPDWLPQGWIMEVRDRRSGGRKYKVYTDLSTGRNFLSKPEVLRYLNSSTENEPSSEKTPTTVIPKTADTPQKPKESSTQKGINSKLSEKMITSSNSQRKKVEIVKCDIEGLPEGWIKEIKVERIGKKIRRDPYYTDRESNYVFRSMPDVFRYIETKDLRSCAIKPRKREDLKFLSDDASIPEGKQSHDNASEENTVKEENHSPTSDQPPKPPVSRRKRGRPVAAPSADNITQLEKPAEVTVDSIKYESEKVKSTPSRSSTRTPRFKGENVGTEGESEENLEQTPVKKLGGSSLHPCLEFSFKNLRSDIPVDPNNLAAQGYDHHQRASVTANVGLPSFSDYARR